MTNLERGFQRFYCVLGFLALALVNASPASAELTGDGWLDFYDGKSTHEAMSPITMRLMALSHALGVADAVIALGVFTCPPGYNPQAEDIAKHTAMVLRGGRARRVTTAVLVALALDGPCDEVPGHRRQP